MHRAKTVISIAILIVLVIVSLPPSQAAKATGPWSALGSGMNDAVYALTVDSSGNLYAGGVFTTAGGTSAAHVAKWNGSSWSALGSGINAVVRVLVVDSNDNVYAAGDFNGVTKWNGSSWSAMGSGLSGTTYALVFDDSGNLYAGGSLSLDGGATTIGIAKWNGSSWSALSSPLAGGVMALAVDGSGNLYAGGTFYNAGGTTADFIAKWNGSSWSGLGTGTNDWVRTLAYDGNGNVYAGGDFFQAGGTTVNHVARWDGSSWSAMSGGVSGINMIVRALATDGGLAYVGGYFGGAGNVSAPNIAVWDGQAWSALGQLTCSPTSSTAAVFALAVDHNSSTVYAGGTFVCADDNWVYYIAKATREPALSLNPTSLSFGNQVVNSPSNAKSITITNVGTAPLTIGFIHVPDMYVIAATTTCTYGKTLAPSETCILAIKFYPNALGVFSGNITIESNAPDSPATVPVSGTAVGGPELNADPTSLSFGNQLVGTTSTVHLLTLANTGTEPVTLSFISVPAKFVNTSMSTCTYAKVLDVGGVCSLAVKFNPTAVGSVSGNITIESDANGSPLSVPVSGTGVAGTQLLKNPGFEVDANANKVPDSWTISNFVATTDGRDCTVRQAGTCSLKLVGNGKLKTVKQTVFTSGGSGDDFTYSLWLRTSNVSLPLLGGAHKLQIIFWNGTKKGAVKVVEFPIGTHAFQRISGTFRAYAGYTKIEFVLSSQAAHGTIWLDTAKLTWAP